MSANRHRGVLPPRDPGQSDNLRRVYQRTNVTGLARRRDYEMAFGPLARERREAMCAPVPFLVALRDRGVPVVSLGGVAAYAPDEHLPQDLQKLLADMNEVVEATGTQILEMRENGGEQSCDFSVRGRQELGILMVALGDARASRLRETAWTGNGQGAFKFSAVTKRAAARDGLSRADYKRMAKDLKSALPPFDSLAVTRVRTTDREVEGIDSTIWISYASLAALVKDDQA